MYERRKHRWLVYGRALLTLCSLALIAGGLLLVATQIRGVASAAAAAVADPPELDPWTKSFQGLRNAQRLNQSMENNASLIVVVDTKRRLQSVLVTNRDPNHHHQVLDTSDNNAKRKRKQKPSKSATSSLENPLQNEIFDSPPTYQLRHQPNKQIQLVVRPIQPDYHHHRPAAGGGRKLCTPCKVIPHRPQRPFYQPTSSPFYISTSSSSSSNAIQSRQRGNVMFGFNLLNVWCAFRRKSKQYA